MLLRGSGGGSGLSAPLPYLTTYEVVRSMDHDGDSFTQGLAFGPSGTLFESRGLYGHSAIRVLDSNDGRTLHEVKDTPEIFGEGIAVMGGTTIAQLSWREGTIHEFNATDLSHLRATEQPRDMNEGWGLATDGRDASVLYASDGSNSLFHLAADGSYTVKRNLRAADSRLGTSQRFAGFEGGGALSGLNELEWVPVGGAGEVWANLYPMNEHKLSECIVRLDPATVRHLPQKQRVRLLTVHASPRASRPAAKNNVSRRYTDARGHASAFTKLRKRARQLYTQACVVAIGVHVHKQLTFFDRFGDDAEARHIVRHGPARRVDGVGMHRSRREHAPPLVGVPNLVQKIGL